MRQRINIGDAFLVAFNTLKANAKYMAVISVAVVAIRLPVALVQEFTSAPILTGLVGLVFVPFQFLVWAGVLTATLSLIDGRKLRFEHVFSRWGNIVPLFVLGVLAVLIISAGPVLFGLFFGLSVLINNHSDVQLYILMMMMLTGLVALLVMAPPTIGGAFTLIEEQVNGLEALRRGWKLCRKQRLLLSCIFVLAPIFFLLPYAMVSDFLFQVGRYDFELSLVINFILALGFLLFEVLIVFPFLALLAAALYRQISPRVSQ